MEQESADGPGSIGSGGEQLDIDDPDSIAAEHRGLPRDRMEFDQKEGTGMKNPSFSILKFLRQVMEDETKDAGTVIGDFGLLLIAVHAAFLDSGFLVLCRGAGKRLPTGWASKQNLVIPISYTTLALGDVCDETVNPIKVKFSQIGKLVSVYVSVSGSLGVYRESFYLPSFIPNYDPHEHTLKTGCWWTASNSAFLNEPSVIETETEDPDSVEKSVQQVASRMNERIKDGTAREYHRGNNRMTSGGRHVFRNLGKFEGEGSFGISLRSKNRRKNTLRIPINVLNRTYASQSFKLIYNKVVIKGDGHYPVDAPIFGDDEASKTTRLID